MDMRRRNFLWGSAVVIGGGVLGLGGAEVLSPVDFAGGGERRSQRRFPEHRPDLSRGAELPVL